MSGSVIGIALITAAVRLENSASKPTGNDVVVTASPGQAVAHESAG